MEYGQEYDFSRPFFEQFDALENKVPHIAAFMTRSTNSPYSNQSYDNKNVYLSFALKDCEDSAYVTRAKSLKNCFDTTYTHWSDLSYECLDTQKAYRSRFLENTEGCVESAFLSNCRNCSNCIGGVNLRSASYMFFGEQLLKEAYEKRIAALDLGSYKTHKEFLKKFDALKQRSIFKSVQLTNCTDCTGDHLLNAKGCRNVFDGFDLENVRNSSWVFHDKDISDVYGLGESEFIYESIGIEEVSTISYCVVTGNTNHSQYLDLCFSSSHLFGCVGLKKKEHCILNKQYDKESFDKLRKEIIEQMDAVLYTDKKGRAYRYGEFFPIDLAPFAYNETVAQEFYPLTKETAEAEGYRWREPETKSYGVTLQPDDLLDRIADVDDSILGEVIGCAHAGTCGHQCATAFKLVPQELQFYKQMNIPLPRLCSNCRHYERIARRNPLRLYDRTCQCAGAQSDSGVYKNTAPHAHHGTGHCPNEFETTYAPDKKEIVYCEQCYNSEVM